MKRTKLRRGSAFLMAMIALAVLTVVGLSLSMVTETESTLGDAEKVINEQFYAAESGSTTQISTLLATNGLEGINIVVPSRLQARANPGARGGDSQFQTGYDVVTSGLAPVDTDEMAYTKVNEGRGDKLFAFYYHMKTLSRRTAWQRKGGDLGDIDRSVPTCEDLDKNELGRTLTQMSFYYAPAGKLPDTALLTLAELDNEGSANLPGVITTNSDCYSEIFSSIGGAAGFSY